MLVGPRADASHDGHSSATHVEATASSVVRVPRHHAPSNALSIRERPGDLTAPGIRRVASRRSCDQSGVSARHSVAAKVPNEGVCAQEVRDLRSPSENLITSGRSAAALMQSEGVRTRELGGMGTPISVSSKSQTRSVPGSPITVSSDSDSDAEGSHVALDADAVNLSWDEYDSEDARSRVAAGLLRYPEDFPADVDYFQTIAGYPIEDIDRRMLTLMNTLKDHTTTVDSRGYYLYPPFEVSKPSRSNKWFVVTWGWRIGVYDNR